MFSDFHKGFDKIHYTDYKENEYVWSKEKSLIMD